MRSVIYTEWNGSDPPEEFSFDRKKEKAPFTVRPEAATPLTLIAIQSTPED